MDIEKYNLPHVDNYIGDDYGESKEGLEDFLRSYYLESGAEFIEGLEIEKTPRDIEILTFLEQAIDDYLRRYGREPLSGIVMEKIHLMRPGGVKEFTNGQIERGGYVSSSGTMLVDREESDVEFGLIALHELTHLKGFNTLQSSMEGDHIVVRRGGFSIGSRDGSTLYFEDLNEAITELLTQRIFQERFADSGLFTEADIAAQSQREQARVEVREKFSVLVGDLYEKNKQDFKSSSEIEDLFIDAAVNGRLLPMARLIEKTYGKGSFRRIGVELGIEEGDEKND